MKASPNHAWFLIGPIWMFAAGCSGSTEVFEETARTLETQGTGPCELSGPLGPRETVIEESAACGAGVCLGYQGQVQCSCRCDGFAEFAPFCSCLSGFVCQADVMDNLGLETPLNAYVGSYCVRAEE